MLRFKHLIPERGRKLIESPNLEYGFDVGGLSTSSPRGDGNYYIVAFTTSKVVCRFKHLIPERGRKQFRDRCPDKSRMSGGLSTSSPRGDGNIPERVI